MSGKRVLSSEFISFMVSCGALLFGDFTLKSGRASPYFVNTGEYKTGAQLSRLGEFYARLIYGSVMAGAGGGSALADEAAASERINSKFNVLFGPAYKGIPLVTAAAMKLSEMGASLNVSFNRKEKKDHGEASVIMGYRPQSGDRVAIVEDVTTAGTSVREIRSLLDELKIDAKITALYVSIDRMERGTGELTAISQIRQDMGIDVHSIASTADVVDYLENTPDGCVKVPDGPAHAAKIRDYLRRYGGKV